MKKTLFFSSLFAGFMIILISIYGFFLLRYRPGLPSEIELQSLKKIDNFEIEKVKDIEFILSQKAVDEESVFYLEFNDKTEIKVAKFVPYYSQTPFPLIYLLIGVFCLAIGILVFFLRSEDAKARIFYWVSLAFSSSLIISGGFYCLRGHWFSYLPGILFNFFYPLSPALLLHFSLSFSKSKVKINRLFIYGPALIFSGILEGLFLHSSMNSSIETHRIYQSIFYVFRCYLISYVLLTILNLIVRYKKSALEEEQAQIKWIFYGLFVGLGPFILLYQLPEVLRINPFISEDFSSVFFVFIPVALAFSIIKFKLMNVELVINRSLVYFILTIFIASFYLFSVRLLYGLFSKFFYIEETAVTLISAIAAAVAFHPARKKIQDFVDKSFFRISYDYRKSILTFNERAQKMVNQDQLVDFFLLKIEKVLPLEQIGLSVYSESTGKPKLIIARNGNKDLDSLTSLIRSSGRILAKKRAVRTEENIEFSKESILEQNELEMVLPLSFRLTALTGFLSLGKKKSGERFSRDDIELLATMTGELTLNLERIRLQEEVIYERAEKEKLDELNRLKTEFVSKVSHELRTPMSSIRGLAEVLQAGKIKEKTKREELLDLVASESSRLSRFLHNILDFGKIERQIKTYNFQEAEIQSIVKEVVELFKQRLESEGFVLKTHLAENPVILKIDQDSVKQALTNLIDNAIKYSAKEREIDILLIEKEKQVEVQVKDKGIGIPPEEQKKIFEGFYRHPEASRHNPEGVGLGLKITRYIMEAHNGEIKVESQSNKGSTFSLIFPK
jgi:signal transduction histidine kinase